MKPSVPIFIFTVAALTHTAECDWEKINNLGTVEYQNCEIRSISHPSRLCLDDEQVPIYGLVKTNDEILTPASTTGVLYKGLGEQSA